MTRHNWEPQHGGTKLSQRQQERRHTTGRHNWEAQLGGTTGRHNWGAQLGGTAPPRNSPRPRHVLRLEEEVEPRADLPRGLVPDVDILEGAQNSR